MRALNVVFAMLATVGVVCAVIVLATTDSVAVAGLNGFFLAVNGLMAVRCVADAATGRDEV